jgi:hypothetical protein
VVTLLLGLPCMSILRSNAGAAPAGTT